MIVVVGYSHSYHSPSRSYSTEDCLKDVPDVLPEGPVVVVLLIDANLVWEDHGVVVGLRVIHPGKELLFVAIL